MSNDTTTVIYTRVGGKLRDKFENWRRAQPVIPPRSEALRSLLDKALTARGSESTAPAIKNTRLTTKAAATDGPQALRLSQAAATA